MASWQEKFKHLKEEINSFKIENQSSLEEFRLKFLSTKGLIKESMSWISEVPKEEKKNFGLLANEVKQLAERKFQELSAQMNSKQTDTKRYDMTMPSSPALIATRHPLKIIEQKIIRIFSQLGFAVQLGPEIEDDWHNFTGLNTPKDHPARDMQDTFYLTQDLSYLLRTQTSSTQIRVLETQDVPLKIITPGRVYRNETISARAHCTFHQIEGLYVDRQVSMSDLKQTVYFFAKQMFGSDQIRLRPSYFPFTEPSAEIDISCFICAQKGCNVCKKSGWVEIGGCGMVDPQVLINCKINPDEFNGYAFGMGLERIAMLYYQINDIRHFWHSDLRFLSQFKSEFP
ncbi:MAG: phenylalanine--tRNA ligase subunit alpha [Chitinophagales bacterium]|jgi:phenylalanyl-tRNA synthetase alpha chain|nr:phenylalanine--tRNA ligase subunit alpha [Chitinophagales bacterium]